MGKVMIVSNRVIEKCQGKPEGTTYDEFGSCNLRSTPQKLFGKRQEMSKVWKEDNLKLLVAKKVQLNEVQEDEDEDPTDD